MKQIYSNVTDETYYALFKKAEEKGLKINELIQIILAEATNTKCILFKANNTKSDK